MTIENPVAYVDDARPIILIRGFGGLGTAEERRVAYQGFNDGTVYPQKRGENYIYEGLVLRLLKSNWKYRDATNIVGYYSRSQPPPQQLPPELQPLAQFFEGRDYLQAVLEPKLRLFLHTGEQFLGPRRDDRADQLLGAITGAADDAQNATVQAGSLVDGEWQFRVEGTGFTGTFGVRLSEPEST